MQLMHFLISIIVKIISFFFEKKPPLSEYKFSEYFKLIGHDKSLAEISQEYEAFCRAIEMFPVKNLCHFLSQVAHESHNLRYREESHNYSELRIKEIFGKYFPQGVPSSYVNSPKLFNRVYANRMGNLDEASGDGSRYKGRGYIQLTGKDNYRNLGYIENPSYLTSPKGAWESAAKFWNHAGLNRFIDDESKVSDVTLVVNGGYNGLVDRTDLFKRAKEYLKNKA